MVYVTGRTYQTAAIPQPSVDDFVELALRVDAIAALPNGNLVSSAWKSLSMSEAAALVDYGHDWWRHLATGYSHFLDPSFLPALTTAVDPGLSFEDCIRRMGQIARDLSAWSAEDRGLARDGMAIARSFWRSTT